MLPRGRPRVGKLYLQVRLPPVRTSHLRLLAQKQASTEILQNSQRDVIRHAHPQHQSLVLAILGNIGNAHVDCVGNTTDSLLLSVNANGSGFGRTNASNRLGQLAPPSSHHAGQPENLSAVQPQIDV